MNWKRVTVLSEVFLFCSFWFSGWARAQPPVTSQTPPATYPADQMMKARKRVKSTVETTPASPATTPQTVPGTPGTMPKSGMMPRTTEATGKAMATHPRTVSDAEIQGAKSSGKVWVNTDSGIYHKGGKWYGATKQGKFMTEQEAMRAGYKPARNEK